MAFLTRRLTARSFCLVKIRTEDGAEGVGYSYGGELIAHAVDLCLAPLLLGRQAGGDRGDLERAVPRRHLLGRRGAVLRALSAVDIALWDLAGKRAGRRWPGCSAAARRRCRPTSGRLLPRRRPLQDVADEAQRALDAGFSRMKIKVGGLGSAEDLERIRLTREALGHDPSSRST